MASKQVTFNGYSKVKPLSKSQRKVKARDIHLSKANVLALVSTFVIMMALVGINLKIQLETRVAETAINNYEIQTLSLNAQTDMIYNQISDQFNYQSIKAAADEYGLTIDGTRVRTVE